MKQRKLLLMMMVLSFSIITVISCKSEEKSQVNTKSDFKGDSEPAGFRGILWLMNLSHLPNMKVLPDNSDLWKFYVNNKESKKIGEANVEQIKYWAMHDKFVKVEIFFSGEENWKTLKKIILERFGEGKTISIEKLSYRWMGKNVSMFLKFDPKSGKGYMDISHHYILDHLKNLLDKLDKHEKELEKIKKRMKEQGLPTDGLENF